MRFINFLFMERVDQIVIELEDLHGDILGKAMRGLGLGKNEMTSVLKVEKAQVEAVLNGECDEGVISGMAEALGLSKSKLIVSARKEWAPAPLQLNGVIQFNLPFGSMRVNAYLLWCGETGKAWVFDTGPEATPILHFLEKEKLSVDAIFLTHTHVDHIACLEELKQKTGNPSVFVHNLEQISGASLIDEGFEYGLGSLSLRALHTHGHSVGGTTYLIDGLEKPVAIAGDSLFAGSMGGGMVSYEDALQNNREKIMTLPEQTIVCPGHGPMTTIEEERRYNPFFP
jgi:hydroxyacylglutathione hydrolase